MVDRPRTTPDPSVTDAVPLSAEPGTGKPVVLATPVEHEFVIPGGDGGKELRITAAGTALSKTDAKRVRDAADAAGVTLIEKEDS